MSILMSDSLVDQVNIDQETKGTQEVKLSAFFYFNEEYSEAFEYEVKRIEWDRDSKVKLISVSLYNFDLIDRFDDMSMIKLPQINLEIKKIRMCGFIIVKSNNYEYELIINT